MRDMPRLLVLFNIKTFTFAQSHTSASSKAATGCFKHTVMSGQQLPHRSALICACSLFLTCSVLWATLGQKNPNVLKKRLLICHFNSKIYGWSESSRNPPHMNLDSNIKPSGWASKTDLTTIQHDEISPIFPIQRRLASDFCLRHVRRSQNIHLKRPAEHLQIIM